MRTSRVTAASLRMALVAAALAALSGTSHAAEYRSSVVGTDFDFILDTDPSAFLCLEYKGQGTREMPDKSGPTDLFQQAFIFVSYFDDGTKVDIAIDIDFETEDEARAEALRYVPRLGKLPTSLRRGVERVVVHKGHKDTTAFSDVGLIVLYSANATKRISTHDLEETVFHESVHASWDKKHAKSSGWLEAQKSDGIFITDYARKNPRGEDLAESALFAYTLLHHPERIPAPDAAKIRSAIPARIAFVKALVPPAKPIFYRVGPKYACDESGTTFTVTAPPEANTCDVDVSLVGMLSDILSNALMHGLHQNGDEVSSFLDEAKRKAASPQELIAATAKKFAFTEAVLNAQVQDFLHCNCDHGETFVAKFDNSLRPETSEPKPVAPEQAQTTAPDVQDDVASTEVYSILRVIAVLLLLLLVVNAGTLVVLIRKSK